MLLLRDTRSGQALHGTATSHTELVRASHAGTTDPAALGGKFTATLEAALRSGLYDRAPLAEVADKARSADPETVVAELLPQLPFLPKTSLSSAGHQAFTRELSDFLHYYESSGTTGNPVAAPKSLDDLIVNTINIGEQWARVLDRSDRALILINAPFAPAAYQFEKVLEYLQVMSMRPWVDNITGDYTRVLRLTRELAVNVFVGPPSRLLEMIQFAYRNAEPVPAFDKLLLMAEQTGPGFVRHLERLTGATAYVASYGSSETGTTAVTCERNNLHLQTQSYLLELTDDSGTRFVDGSADRGELVVTSLDMPARPLLRYRTGDLVEIPGTPCPCGVATPLLRTLGRSQDLIVLEGNGIRQNDFEAALWPAEHTGPTVLNYMLVIRGDAIVCLATTDQDVDEEWSRGTAERLGTLFPGYDLALRAVEKLPPLASLGQYLGWKLSRVLDLNDARNWDRLPAPIRGVVETTLADLAPASQH
ncbi:phenylacetate--CoA ligase family protein [Streptomyces sp. NRRL F-5123]|uniref:phenylacetate--CoA ligase family protein n=1 Tax=Streptomyces sp. NRRL F-5123 TaxID=1463856 RepID=UPI0004E1ABDC|nr:phenylacetate--CoA ligase family protein [Streptomyces sp. NRRL F-5123]